MLTSLLPRLRLDQFSLGGLGNCATPGSTPCCTAPGCAVTICVTGCPGGTPLTAAVTVVGEGSCGTVAALGGCCGVSLPDGAGTYTVSVSASGYKPWAGPLALACGGTVTVELQPDTALPSVQFHVLGCCTTNLPGSTVALSDGQSCTTDAAGLCKFWIAKAGTYTYTVTGPCGARFTPVSGSFTLANCVTATDFITVGLAAAAGYVCELDGPYPVPTTLHLTDSIYGSCTMTYDAIGHTWVGTIAACSMPAQDYGPGAFGVENLCPSSTFVMTYKASGICGFGLAATFNAIKCCRCLAIGGFTTITQALVPSDVIGPHVPCLTDPLKCDTALLPNQANNLSSAPVVLSGWPSCPLNAVVTIPMILCGGFPCILESTGGAQPEAWTNFGGTITITE